MADFVDQAEGYSDNVIEQALTKAKNQKVEPRGKCLFCGEPVQGVFCDPHESDCRDEWEKRQKMNSLQGR